MSTDLKNLSAKIEIPQTNGEFKSNYKDTKVQLTRFSGGTERGVSLQLGFRNEEGSYQHIQLDAKNIKKLRKILKNNF